MTAFVVVIPARMASTRLPGKPLLRLDDSGRPMIAWVHAVACRSDAQQVIVATENQEIVDACREYDARAEMTGSHHQSGTDRIAEVAERLKWPDDLIVVNVQGDEPLLPPALIDQTAGLLEQHPDAGIATLMTPLASQEEFESPDIAKVVVNHDGYALYFSRAPIPATRDGTLPPDARRHIGLYAYRVHSLKALNRIGSCELERVERLEQLRALCNGVRIAIADAVAIPPRSVDTEEDLDAVRALIAERGVPAESGR